MFLVREEKLCRNVSEVTQDSRNLSLRRRKGEFSATMRNFFVETKAFEKKCRDTYSQIFCI